MDIFKLLSRSTKLPRHAQSKSAADGAAAQRSTIPSDGPSSTPQLFGTASVEDNETLRKVELVLGKRKRGSVVVDEAIPAELDFFGERQAQVVDKEKGVSKRSGVREMGKENTDMSNDLEDEEDDELDVDTCKRVLRAHKVKITALSDTPATSEPIADLKQKKKSKRRKKQEEELKKAKTSQTYVRPLSSFVQLQRRYGLKNIILENINAQGYSVPTEVQLAGLPLLMGESLMSTDVDGSETVSKGNPIDLLAVAPTGSGKTLAFLIPILNALLTNRSKSTPAERPASRAIIIAPTRELASQIVNEGRKLAIKTGLKISLVKKGMKIGTDEDHVLNDILEVDDDGSEDSGNSDEDETVFHSGSIVKSDVVVSTPMALVHALERKGALVARLPSVQYLVLDEADVLLDPLFREQTLSIWHACTNPELRTTLWSATMGSSIESLALSTISDRKESQQAPIIRLVVGLKDTALPTLTHTLTYAATEAGKLLALRQLLHPIASTSSDLNSGKELRPPFLVFTQTIARAIALQSELRYDIPPEAGGSSRMAVLHAGLSESARSRVMAGFRRGEIWVIITTDLLARGVDFRGLNGVVNYDVPTSAAAYVHRAGRTGRAGRKGGVVITLYTKEDIPFIKPVANVIAASEKARGDSGNERNSVQQWLLDALPTPTKRDKKNLKQRGLEIRRPGVKGAMISTKAPRNHAKSAWSGSKRPQPPAKAKAVEDTEFEGFAD